MKTIARISDFLLATGGTLEISMALGVAGADFCLRPTLFQIVGTKRVTLGSGTIRLLEKTPGRFCLWKGCRSHIGHVCRVSLAAAGIEHINSQRARDTLARQQQKLLALLRRAHGAPAPRQRKKIPPTRTRQ